MTPPIVIVITPVEASKFKTNPREAEEQPMATKNNPGPFDCYEKADPDEPMFVLLGRDRFAASLVYLWALAREPEVRKVEKVREARECAQSMLEWLVKIGSHPAEILAHIPYEILAEELRRRGATVTPVPDGGDYKSG